MKLPFYHYSNHRVVIWNKNIFETLNGEKMLEIEYSKIKSDGCLSNNLMVSVKQHEFTSCFELQPDKIEIGWNRIVPKSETNY